MLDDIIAFVCDSHGHLGRIDHRLTKSFSDDPLQALGDPIGRHHTIRIIMDGVLRTLRALIRENIITLVEADNEIWVKGHWQARAKPAPPSAVTTTKLDDLIKHVLDGVEKQAERDMSPAKRRALHHKLKKHVKGAIDSFKEVAIDSKHAGEKE